MPEMQAPFKNILKAHRQEKGWTLKTVGEMLGVDRSRISQIENGYAGNPSQELLRAYCQLLGLDYPTMSDLLAKEKYGKRDLKLTPELEKLVDAASAKDFRSAVKWLEVICYGAKQ